MTDRITRKQLKHDDFVETAFDVERWFETNWRPVVAVVGGAALVALLAWGYTWWSRRAEERAAARLSEALAKTAAATTPGGGWAEALPLLEEAAGPRTEAGRTAAFYRGVALLNLSRGTEALPILESVAKGEGTLADVARARLAWAYQAAGQPDRAIELWKDLAARADGAVPADIALYQVAAVQHAASRSEEAKATVQDLLARFQQGAGVVDAQKLAAQLGIASAGSLARP
jgi:tetratricopeptide (TPR) repeat protein